jgi:hypothetical protein
MIKPLVASCLLMTLIGASLNCAEPAFRTKFIREVVDAQPTLVNTFVEQAPTIDGEVDNDPVWRQCGRTMGAWTGIGTKEASGRQTVTYACHDKQNLYFGFVCEETELQQVQMNGALVALGGGNRPGGDDSVEVVLEVGGLQGEGDVYAFRANCATKAHSWGSSAIPNGVPGPQWTSAGKHGPNRWMVEMAIPFAALQRGSKARSMPPPIRGDVLGIKLARYGAAMSNGSPRMVSTFNVELPYNLLYVCGYNGLLYFRDSNVLADGNFPAAGTAWSKSGDVTAVEGGGLALGAGGKLSQDAIVQPSSYYLVSVTGDAGATISIDGQAVALTDAKGGFWTKVDQRSAKVSVQANAKLAIKSLSLELQPGEEPPGPLCLTNNYKRPGRNLRAIDPSAPDGSYRYVYIDYNGNVTGDAHPNNKIKLWWSHDPNLVVQDLGGVSGYIPFSKGSLTGRPEIAFWQPDNPAGYPYGCHLDMTLDIDLGQDYFVSGLDVLWPSSRLKNIEIWGKLDGAADWTYLYNGDGPFVEPSKRISHLRGYEQVRELDSVVRHLRWRSTMVLASPQMDGIQEFWVWGEPKKGRTQIKTFRPWISKDVVPPQKGRTAVVPPDTVSIVPRPRSLQMQEGNFVFTSATRLVAQDNAIAKRIAGQIGAEIAERWNVKAAVVAEGSIDAAVTDNLVYIGISQLSEGAKAAANQAGTAADQALLNRQGYALKITPQRITVIGDDGDGLYWGAQSLLMSLRWKNGGTPGPATPAMTISDWPGAYDRAIYQKKGYAAMLNVPVEEIPRVKRICQLLSRFKINVVYLTAHNGDGGQWGGSSSYSWHEGTLAKLCREVREEFHLELRPMLIGHEGMTSWWKALLKETNHSSDAEADPDEAQKSLGDSENVCPLDPQTYVNLFAKFDRILEQFGRPGKTWLGGQALAGVQNGARWAVCRRCQRSGKSNEEIYTYFLQQIADHLQERDTVGVLGSQWLRLGDGGRDPKDQRLISIDPRMLPRNLVLQMPGGKDSAWLKDNFDPLMTCDGPVGWPSADRIFPAPWTETEILCSLGGGDLQSGTGSDFRDGSLVSVSEKMWYSPGACPDGTPNMDQVGSWINSWWFRRELPSWRAGERPTFIPIDLRPFANHTSHATGQETLEPGRPPELDLRYLPTGEQKLAGVTFDIIDPSQNGGKSVLMLGRPPKSTLAQVAATISETTPPIPVKRKLSSLVFLRSRWQCSLGSGMHWSSQWLRPTCRVVYEDGTWMVVDSYLWPMEGFCFDNWTTSQMNGVGLYYKLGWAGNTPNGSNVNLTAVEWVNPYPELTIAALEYFTPDFGKRVNDMVEAIVGISGVEATPQDIAFWSWQKNRPPRLGTRKAPAVAGQPTDPKSEVATLPGTGFMKGNPGESRYFKQNNVMWCGDGFHDFGGTQTFAQPTRLCGVAILGPRHPSGDMSELPAWAPRTQKLDVSVEISEDGTTWRKVGAVRGIVAEADFQPIEFPPTMVKAVRFTATGAPYHEFYHPTVFWGGMFTGIGASPNFSWRLIAPN